MFDLLITIQNISVVVIVLSTFYVMRQRPSHVQKDLVVLNMALLITIVSYTLEMQATTMEAAILATKTAYIGRPIILFTMFFAIIDITQIQVKPIIRTLAAAIQIIFMFIIINFDKHNLYYTDIKFVNEGMFPHLVKGHGPLYYLYVVIVFGYSIAMIVMCYLHSKRIKNKKDKEILVLLIIMVLCPNIGYYLQLLKITGGYNATYLGYALGADIFMYIFVKYNVFEAINVAWENVFKFIGAGLLVYDHFGNLLYQNEMAKEINITDRANELYKSREYIYHEDKVYRVEKLPITNNGVSVGYAYYIDNETDNYNYENLLREEKKRADEANSQKTKFLSSMSHDIRTPMNAILGLTDIAKIHIADKARVTDCLNKINTSGRHLLELINEVLDMNKIESGTFELINEDFDIADLLDEISVMSRALVDAKEHTLTVDSKSVAHSWVNGDKSRLSQVIMNLISNSVKYTNNGGLIIAKIEETNCVDNKATYRIIVRDNGIGISEEYLPTIFDPYTREKSDAVAKAQGTGLGMSISKSFVEMMGGTISVRSTLGMGTTFEIYIPFELADESTRKKTGLSLSDISKVDYRGKRILVVEDNAVNAEIMGEFLALSHISVEYAKDGLDALEKVKSSEDGKYDLIFMDVQMPRMNGCDATRNIRALERDYAKNVPIIAVTGNAFAEEIAETVAAGMNAHITKPVVYDKLYEVLSEYLE